MLTYIGHTMDSLIIRIWSDASAITNLFVAIVALWVYYRSRQNQVSDAASLVELDIRLMAEQIAELKKILTHNNNFALINIGSRISDTWNTNKAVLVSKLSFDDISAINAFIASYSRLRDLHQGAIKIYEAGASSKAEEFQKRICESLFINNADDITKSASSKHPSFVAYNAHSFVFSPLHYIDDAINVLNNQENFIQTPAFRNLSLLAQRSRRWFIFKRK